MKRAFALMALLVLGLALGAPVRAQQQSGAAAPAAVQAQALDGTHWKMKTSFWHKLIFWRHHGLKFENGQFSSSWDKKRGIKPVPYAANEVNGKIHWTAESTSDKGVKFAWDGTVDGDMMSGNTTFSDKNGKTKTHAFSAAKRAAKKKK